MKNNLSTILKFSGILLVILLISFPVQLFFSKNQEGFNTHLLLWSYAVNFLLAATIFSILIFLKKKYTHLLGFVYMGGSMVKFVIFFIFFSPIFKSDGQIDRIEALIFLIPYFISLIFETTYLVRLLNK